MSDQKREPMENPAIARGAAELVRRARAVGLVDESPDFPELTLGTVMSVVERIGRLGIAEHAIAELTKVEPSESEAFAGRLHAIAALLEESPLPESEWGRLIDVLGRDDLARLLEISPSSANRYERGERRTPDDVAARLHFLALVVGDLAGAYNDLGIRRWFHRSRTALDDRAPAELLAGGWDPEHPGPRRVRALARSLITSPAT